MDYIDYSCLKASSTNCGTVKATNKRKKSPVSDSDVTACVPQPARQRNQANARERDRTHR